MLLKQMNKLAIFTALLLVPITCLAQEQKPEQKAQPSASSNSVYRLEYVFSEVQNGRKVNARSYSTLLHAGERGSIRLGSRVPISINPNQSFQYIDVGLNIDARLEREVESGVALFTSIDVTSLPPDQPKENGNLPPIVRQTKFQVDNIISLEKRTLIGSADQIDGTGRFDLEVTATKLR